MGDLVCDIIPSACYNDHHESNTDALYHIGAADQLSNDRHGQSA